MSEEKAVAEEGRLVSAEEHRAEIEAEYGVYAAAGPIAIDGVLAFNTGDAVPVSHVKNGLVPEDQVTKR